MRLTIGIPTYNRALKLKLQLNNLCKLISKSSFKNHITVYVSNNGSNDNTIEIIKEYEVKFKQSEISFISNNFPINKGFDTNILFLYYENKSDFIWFLSDDDEIQENSIEQIFIDINKHNPDIVYYNFNQEPYTFITPYIEQSSIYKFNDNITGLKKIINWPKLTSLVFKKRNNNIILPHNNFGFAHIELVLFNSIPNGIILFSNYFIASVQNDYLDNINFPPYIGNSLNQSIKITLEKLDQNIYYEILKIPNTDPLISSLNMLGASYRNKFLLNSNLKNELLSTIKYELKKRNYKLLINYRFIFELFKYIISYLFFVNKYANNFFYKKK